MKTLLYAAVAAASLAIAAPALAQSYPSTVNPTPAADPGHNITAQLDALRLRVKNGLDQGQLTPSEADRLYREVDHIRTIAQNDRDTTGELRDADRMDLQSRIDTLSASIHWQRAEATTASPQPYAAAVTETAYPAQSDWSLDKREDWLSGRIEHGVEAGRLSGNEVARGRQELRAIRDEQAKLIARDGGGLSETDRVYLQNRLDELNRTLRWEGRNPSPPWARGA